MYISLSVWSIIVSLDTRGHNRHFVLCAVKLKVLGLKAYQYTGSAFHQIPSIIFKIIHIWNALPSEAVIAPTLEQFSAMFDQ